MYKMGIEEKMVMIFAWILAGIVGGYVGFVLITIVDMIVRAL